MELFKSSLFITLSAAALLMTTSCGGKQTLAEAYADYFPIGAAVNTGTIDSAVELLPEFASLTAENEMKPITVQPRLNSWQTYAADEIADYARDNGMSMRGHTFVWHNQTPGWFFAELGSRASRETLLRRVREHMEVMAERYNDVVYAWDVVNEAISDNPDEFLRPSPYLDIVGEDYIDQAFLMAREIMPDTLLFYNDYSVLDSTKQDKIYRLLSDMLDRGIPVDGIGIQGHWNIYYPDAQTLENTIQRFAALGLEVHITELDLSIFRHEDRDTRYREPPKELLELQADRYELIFEVLRRNAEHVGAVTLWGIADDSTWLDNFPVSNRKNWPLLFDEDLKPKEAYHRIKDF